jgi:hypothetical protein
MREDPDRTNYDEQEPSATELHDLTRRALSVIEESDGADEHSLLIGQLRALVSWIDDVRFCSGRILFRGEGDQ